MTTERTSFEVSDYATSSDPILPDRRADIVDQMQQEGERRGRLTQMTREEFDRILGHRAVTGMAGFVAPTSV